MSSSSSLILHHHIPKLLADYSLRVISHRNRLGCTTRIRLLIRHSCLPTVIWKSWTSVRHEAAEVTAGREEPDFGPFSVA